MKLGVLTVPLYSMPTEKAFEYLSSIGVQAVEIGVGGYPGNKHLNPAELFEDASKVEYYKELLEKNRLTISALSVHGNAVHPNREFAEKSHAEFIDACKAAQKLGVDTIVTFSGCPGDYDGAKQPNWVTCSWPPEYLEILDYQWNERLIPYWREAAKIAAEYGVTKIALEMHPGFSVYNTGTLLRLREAVGEAIGANFDPSHLFWQGIDPCEAIKRLKGAIYHFHAKDTWLEKSNIAVNGVLDATHYGDILNRSWVFRTVGYGHGVDIWNDIISTLRATGYEGSISIEHEDSLMSVKEGLEKAVSFLKNVILFEGQADMWWA